MEARQKRGGEGEWSREVWRTKDKRERERERQRERHTHTDTERRIFKRQRRRNGIVKRVAYGNDSEGKSKQGLKEGDGDAYISTNQVVEIWSKFLFK